MDGIFGIGPLELFFIAIIALIVLGPERLPHVLRETAKTIRRFREITNEFTGQFSEELKALDEINPRKILNEMTDPTKPVPGDPSASKTAAAGKTTAAGTTNKPVTKPAPSKASTASTNAAASSKAATEQARAIKAAKEAQSPAAVATVTATTVTAAAVTAEAAPTNPVAEQVVAAEALSTEAISAEAPLTTAAPTDTVSSDAVSEEALPDETISTESEPHLEATEPNDKEPEVAALDLSDETDDELSASDGALPANTIMAPPVTPEDASAPDPAASNGTPEPQPAGADESA